MDNRIKSYKALLFDFDGTLFDTKELNFKAYSLAYFDLGVTITREMFAKTDGLSVYDFNRAMGVECNVEELKRLKAQYYRKYSVYATPNEYLINVIKNTRLKTALVTTARFENILPLLKKYDLLNKFYRIITQDDIKKHKPDPEAYNVAMNLLGLISEDCLAFEDSRPGFVAARRAGIDCIQIKRFESDCIVNMTGGSDSTTKLLWSEKDARLVVEKKANTFEATQRLRAQCDSLRNVFSDCIINVLESEFTEETCGQYIMPYIFSNTLYDYKNRIGIFQNVLENIYKISCFRNDYFCTGNVRYQCWKKYIIPGLKIYSDSSGKRPWYWDCNFPYEFWQELPSFLDCYNETKYHGDTTFENILICRDSSILFIDPVPDGNVVKGRLHDFAKIGQSLMGYEAIRDGVEFDYTIEKQIFNDYVKRVLTEEEYKSLKFHVACLFFRRLKHQVEQRPELVIHYGDIALRLLTEFSKEDYQL